MVSKKLFFLILGISAGVVVGLAAFVMTPSVKSEANNGVAPQADIRGKYKIEVNKLIGEYLFGRQDTSADGYVANFRDKLLALRAPKELREFHLKLIVLLDKMTALGQPEEARASTDDLEELVRTEAWIRQQTQETHE